MTNIRYGPDDSENVVLFERATFLTGVVAAQSWTMPAKLKASPKVGGVQNYNHFQATLKYVQGETGST